MELTLHADGPTATSSEAGGQSVVFDLPEAEGGGNGMNGGEALMLAVGGCYANDLRRRANEHGIALDGFTIHVSSTWGGEPVTCTGITCRVEVETDAPQDALEAMLADLDAKAAIPAALRQPTPVTIE